MESKKLLKKAAISLVSANILATTVITSIPVHSWAAEEIQKTESYDNQIAKGNNLKAAQPGTINVTVVDKDGKPLAGYGIGWKDETINVGWQGKKSSSDGTAVFASSLVDPTHKYSFFVMTDANGNEINPSVHISIEPTDFKNGIANIKLPALKRVMPSDLGNQQWLIDMAEHYTGKVIGKDMSFPDLEKVTTLQSYEGFEVKDTNPVLPAGIKYFTGLQKINLRSLGLTGTIPMELGNLTNLTYLDLHDNKLEGNIPNNLNKLSKLARLDFGVNKLTGEIPSNLGELIGLTDLALGNNQLTGTIPSSLGNLTKLQALWLRNNKLVGQIPEQLFSLDAIKTAEFLDNEVTLNQTGSKEFASGITPNYMNTFVNERTLVATKSPALIKGTSVSPFRDFGLKAEINGKQVNFSLAIRIGFIEIMITNKSIMENGMML
ncbi:leucine-rich repeat domain-containing protein [Listeria aquatica]|uniref:leucine-rich repeat domain-containing protein n=1 Tax=Listeria aquatica TaxID=1494960 RepID=UPI0031F5B5F6